MKKRWLVMIATCFLFIGAGGTYTGIKWSANNEKESLTKESNEAEKKDSSGQYADLGKIGQAYELIHKAYVEEVDHEQLVQGAIQGMVGTLNDPYSVYMDKQTTERFNDSLDSSFDGIGAQVTIEEGKLLIVAPIKNTPAEKAKLKPRDQILTIDGESVEGLDLHEATTKIRGEKGTVVKLEILRQGSSKPFEVSITRDEVPIVTVFSEVKKNGEKKIGYMEITSFAENTAKDFINELQQLEEKEKIDGLIIDVRGNPGGMLSSVEEILQELVRGNEPYVQIEERDGSKKPYASGLKEKKPYPISVLIDEGSASASEILAAALNEIEGYDLIGTKTFGKGTVQQAVPLDDGSNIKLTMFKWLTPKGNWIHEKGIKPTIEVKQPVLFYAHSLVIEETLARDMNNEDVKLAQQLLTGLGYGTGRKDGYFDEQTERAVRAFQSIQKVAVTGKIDEQTANKMEEAIIQTIQDEKNDLQLQVALKSLQ